MPKRVNDSTSQVLDAAVSNTLGAAGGIVGLAFGPAGAIVGTGIGAAVGTALRRLRVVPAPLTLKDRICHYFTIRRLLARKLADDIALSFLQDAATFRVESRRIRDNLMTIDALDGEADTRLTDEEWDCSEEMPDDHALESSVQILRQRGCITIAASSIMVGCIATLDSMKTRHGINLHVRFKEPSGCDQVQLIEAKPDEYDFHIVPVDAVFLADPAITRQYTLIGPINGEVQEVFRKHAHGFPRHAAVWTYLRSSAEMQYRLGVGIPGNTEVKGIESVKELAERVTEMPSGDYVILWRPLANSRFGVDGLVSLEGSRYCVTYCLFANRRWRRSIELQVREAFKRKTQNGKRKTGSENIKGGMMLTFSVYHGLTIACSVCEQ